MLVFWAVFCPGGAQDSENMWNISISGLPEVPEPEYAKKCVDIIRAKSKSIFIEISGGVTLENVSDYIIDGVDAISSGALMHQAQNQKLKLEFTEAQI